MIVARSCCNRDRRSSNFTTPITDRELHSIRAYNINHEGWADGHGSRQGRAALYWLTAQCPLICQGIAVGIARSAAVKSDHLTHWRRLIQSGVGHWRMIR